MQIANCKLAILTRTILQCRFAICTALRLRRSAGSGESSRSQDLVDQLDQVLFGNESLDLVCGFGVLVENQDARYGKDLVLVGQVEVIADIDLAYLDAVGKLPRDAVNDG